MTLPLKYLLTACVLLHHPCWAQGSAASDPPLEYVLNALSVLLKEGPVAAAKAWTRGGAAEYTGEGKRLETYLWSYETNAGKAESSEILYQNTTSERSRAITFIVYYNKGALFGRTQMIKLKSGNWVPTAVLLSPDGALITETHKYPPPPIPLGP